MTPASATAAVDFEHDLSRLRRRQRQTLLQMERRLDHFDHDLADLKARCRRSGLLA